MKNKDLLHAMNEIDDKYISSINQKKHKKYLPFIGIGAAACICIAAGAIWLFKTAYQKGDSDYSKNHAAYSNYIVAAAEYPKCVPYPTIGKGDENDQVPWDNYASSAEEWSKDRYSRTSQSKDYLDGLYPFYETTLKQLLCSDKDENQTYSPLSLYMALSMLAEVTDGNSRAQILNLLDADNIEDVRKSASALWNANYSDDGAVTSILANSLWLNQDISYIQSTMHTLAQTYYASAFQGEMGSPEFTQAFQDWLNEQTGGMLTQQAGQIAFDPQTVLALANTIYYRAQWYSKFNKEKTSPDVFYSASGELTCDFMNRTHEQMYYWGDDFAAVVQYLEHSGGMWLILPDEGVSVNELINNGTMLDLIHNYPSWENKIYIRVNLSMPKFDIVSDFDLSKTLKAMGVTDIFDSFVSDFSPMTKKQEIFVSSAKHAARVMVDEDGCTATAFTAMAASATGIPPEEEVDFILNRPFLFAITGADGSLLFAGTVKQP